MKWKNKNVLITGINGFVGSYLGRHLLDKGADVFGFVRRKAEEMESRNLKDRGIQRKVHLIEGDVTDIPSLAQALDIAKPEVIYHLAAQSFVPRSFENPTETIETNILGTENLLEAVRIKGLDPIIIFAGSSEEYGLVIASMKQYKNIKKKYKVIFPEPKIPEVPVSEENPLRPMSPYAVTKVACDYLMRNYYYSYGLKTIVSRGFNQEGAGRGINFVTSVVTSQVMKLKFKETDRIMIGNVNVFRDWSHILDIVKGYTLLAEKGKYGDVYNQGSCRTNSVLTYILLSLKNAGFRIEKIESLKNKKVIENPLEKDNSKMFGVKFPKTKVDRLMLEDKLEFALEDRGIWVWTDKGKIPVVFDEKRFRSAEVPILLSDTSKIKKLGFKIKYSLEDIIRDQLNYFTKKENRI